MTKYSPDLFDKICESIATTSNGLKNICKENGVSSASFYTWIKDDVNLLDKYTCAREAQADLLADQIIAIADDSKSDTEVRYTSEGEPYDVENKEWTSRSKLRVEARKWIASKLKPKKYGDKHAVDITSEGKAIKQIFKIGNQEIEL